MRTYKYTGGCAVIAKFYGSTPMASWPSASYHIPTPAWEYGNYSAEALAKAGLAHRHAIDMMPKKFNKPLTTPLALSKELIAGGRCFLGKYLTLIVVLE